MRSFFLSILLIISLVLLFSMQNKTTMGFTPALQSYCDSVAEEFELISAERKKTLDSIAQYISAKKQAGETCNLTFICVHNSRRSHFGQAWANTAGLYYGVDGVEVYSGGVEVTACNPRTVSAMQRTGLLVEKEKDGFNPQYRVKAGEDLEGCVVYSKRYDDLFNPRKNFAAIMVCGEGDEACPLVNGADERFLIPYPDPKQTDGTPQETKTYDERCRQIAREVFYVYSTIK
jgi:arsenate reductase (thioredoxin)